MSWEPAQLLIEDTDPRFLNDKNSMTADPNDPNFVYAVWDRIQTAKADTMLGPAENRVGLGFKGPIYFARTTNGGDSWEPARKIWESGANKQALGDQIAVPPPAVLVFEQHDVALGVEAGLGPGVLEQQQRGKPHDLGLGREQAQQQAREPDRGRDVHRRGVLAQVRGGTRLEGAEAILQAVEGAEHHQPRARILGAQTCAELGAAAVGQTQIQQDDVGAGA